MTGSELLTQALHMYIHGPRITHVFITPDMIQKLFPGKYLIGGRGKKV